MGRKQKPIWFDGEQYPSMTELCKKEKISTKTVYERLDDGEPIIRGSKEIYIDWVITFDDLHKI